MYATFSLLWRNAFLVVSLVNLSGSLPFVPPFFVKEALCFKCSCDPFCLSIVLLFNGDNQGNVSDEFEGS